MIKGIKGHHQPNQVRIIAGKWKNRKIHFSGSNLLRPTTDRVRETLFNWLNSYLVHANCLDLFAGSGILGFEALSRGANHVYFLEKEIKNLKNIQDNVAKLQAQQETTLIQGVVPESANLNLSPTTPSQHNFITLQGFDIVFLDPPYHNNLIPISLNWLLNHHYLGRATLIYFEAEKQFDLNFLKGFHLYKHQMTSTLQYGLLKWETNFSE